MNATEKYPQLTTSQVALGMLRCRENARELLCDADLLTKNERYARAYMTLHTACEELAKFFVLDLAGRRLAQGNPPPWKRFWQRFRSHESKITQLSVQLLVLQTGSETVDPALLAAADTLFGYDLRPRNASLYVDIGPDGEFRKPSDLDFSIPLPILWGITMPALRLTDYRGETAAEIESHLHQSPSEVDRNTALRVIEIAMRRMRDAGLSKSEAVAGIEKYMTEAQARGANSV